MLSFQLISLAAALFSGLTTAHTGMVDDDYHRDVGLVYTQPNFQGDSKAIFQVKNGAECLPLGQNVMSILICKTDVKCAFYTGTNCNTDSNNFAVTAGCGEVANFDSEKGHYFGYYSCGAMSHGLSSNRTLISVPHDSSKD